MDADLQLHSSVESKHSERPETIYAQITEKVREVITAFDNWPSQNDDEDEINDISRSLHLVQDQVAERQSELRAYSEWRQFTVAFYGETNAGKSTIIETLRILLGEISKEAQRADFRTLAADFGLTDESLAALHHAQEEARGATATASLHIRERERLFPDEITALETEKNDTEQEALTLWNARPWWKKFFTLFGPTDMERVRADFDERIADALLRYQSQLAVLAETEATAAAEVVRLEADQERRMRQVPDMLALSDGAIIGDGRPDFTQSTGRYAFDAGGAQFTLLDVPGIEGNEASVQASIDAAVQTAHAVLYVTGKAARPQHGDRTQGTLEKIKRHLGPQTEVWAIYNKRITSVFPLRNGDDLFARDVEGILDLEQGLSEGLGEQFKGVMPVSAYPAFLAVADHLPPQAALAKLNESVNGHASARTSFLNVFDAPYLLEKSGFAQFARHVQDMAQNAPAKIRIANVKKANQVLKDVVTQLDEHASVMEAYSHRVKEQTAQAEFHIEEAAAQYKNRLRNSATRGLAAFEADVRKAVYDRIEKGIDKSDLKQVLGDCIDVAVPVLQAEIEERATNAQSEFQISISQIAKRFRKRVEDLEHLAGVEMDSMATPMLAQKLHVNSGIRWGRIALAGVSVVALYFTPVALPILILQGFDVAISIVKGLWSYFDSDFRNAQQRKVVDKQIVNTVAELRKQLNAYQSTILKSVKDGCAQVKQSLEGPLRGSQKRAQALRRSEQGLRALVTQLNVQFA